MSTPVSDPTPNPRRSGPPTAIIIAAAAVVVSGILVFALSQSGGGQSEPAANAPVAMGNLPARESPAAPGASSTTPANAPAGANAPAPDSTPPPAPANEPATKQGGTVSGKFTPPKPAVDPNELPPDHPPITADEGTQVGIQWLGHSCFYIHSPGGVAVVTDPFDPKATGLPSPGIRAHLVTTSASDPVHGHVQGVKGFLNEATLRPEPLLTVGTDPMTQKDTRVTPIRTDSGNVHLIEAGSLRIVHLGGIRRPLSRSQISALGKVDILMIPVGGGLPPKQAVELTKAINPAIVMPMAYSTSEMEGAAAKLPPAEAFISASPYAVTRKDSDVMLISRNELPASTEVFLLRYGR